MKRVAPVGIWRIVFALGVAFAAGVQISLYLWDMYEDRTGDPLSASIGVAFFAIALWVGLRPFRGKAERPGR